MANQSSDGNSFQQSLWSAISAPGLFSPRLTHSIETDVLVVGAGLLGLSTALHLAEAGVKVTLIEGDEVGYGASGRNTGFVVPALKSSLGPQDVARYLGDQFGENLLRLVGSSGHTVFDLIRRFDIACSAEQTGWFQPAHTVAMARVLDQRAAEWRRRGINVEMVTSEETTRRLGMPGFDGALFVPSGGQINPLDFTRGLARTCLTAGVSVFERTRAIGLEKTGPHWRVRTDQGSVLAERVLLTTNALAGRLVPEVAASIIPTLVHQIASQVFPASTQARILPGRSPLSDTRRHTLAVRWSPDGRLITGGLVLPGPGKRSRASRFFSRRLETFFPEAGQIKAEYVWDGIIGVTTDWLPRYMVVKPGLEAAIGCNGRGIAMTVSLGKDIARMIAGKIGIEEFALPQTKPRAVPGRALAEFGPHLYLPWSEFRDRMDMAGRRKPTD